MPFEVSHAQVGTHDPSTVVEEDDRLWSVATGGGVAILQGNKDGEGWKAAGRIFGRGDLPAWHKEMVPENRGHLWAPDVIRSSDGKRWWVYYSISSFGKNTSAIGMVSSESLDPEDGDFEWKDEGMVVRSERSDRYNAIDPAILRDGDKLWMSYGSFWDGIMLIELDAETGLRKDPDSKPIQLANHPEIEAPFIDKRNDWYYLFVNHGKCCRGAESTYEIVVGRSRKIEGPYVDREGDELLQGGGTSVLATEGRWIGPGHASIVEIDDAEMLVHHFYDGEDRGRSKLRLVPLRWVDGWPVAGEEKSDKEESDETPDKEDSEEKPDEEDPKEEAEEEEGD